MRFSSYDITPPSPPTHLLNQSLESALAQGTGVQASNEQPASATDEARAEEPPLEDDGPKVITTAEEIEAYYIVKSILRPYVDIKRVIMRDVQSYCGILLDDNNRKPICCFHFNAAQKY
jgi:hypothetical protein